MSNRSNGQWTRRGFLKLLAVGPMASLGGVALWSGRAYAGDLPHLAESDSAAEQLGYKHDASQVDAKRFPQHQTGQVCSNCRYFKGKSSDQWGPCAIFPGKAVNADGWCAAYAAK